MFGRQAELRQLRALVDGAREGRSGAVLLHGEAGTGKSTILAAIAAEAAGGCIMLRASGVASESTVAWSGLADLCRPILEHLDGLPGPQRAALAGALALGPPADCDRFAVGIATLGLLAAAASQAPVVAIIDDAQWLDTASVGAILFAGRRLHAEGVALLLAVRDGSDNPHDLSWLERLPIDGLDDASAREVLAEHARGAVAPAVVDRVLQAATGNPLVLAELARSLTAEQLTGRAPLPEPLPVPASLERELTARLLALPDRTRRALTVAAAHGGRGGVEPVRAALASLGLDLADLAPAEVTSAVRLSDGQLEFMHPLLRSAAYRAVDGDERRAAHRALADALRDEPSLEARARHLASASIGPDEAVAGVLEAAAGQARRAGALSVAADLARKASLLSPAPAARARRAVAAASYALLGGGVREAREYLDEVGPIDDPELRIQAAQLRGRWHVLAGGVGPGVDALVEVGEATAEADPAGAARLLVHAAAASLAGGRHERAAMHARRAVELADGIEPVASLAGMAEAATRVVAGEAEDGARLLAAVKRMGDDDLLEVAQPTLLAVVAALIWIEDFDRAEELVDTVIRSARRVGALGVLPLALGNRAWVLLRRPRVAAAEAAASEALELAEITGQRSVVLFARQLLAHIAALAGRYDEARLLATQVLDAVPNGSLTPLRYNATMALAHAELAEGRHAIAIELLEQIVDPGTTTPYFRNPAAFGAAFQLIEALIHAGREAEARALLAQTEDAAGPLRQRWPRGQVARMHGLLDAGYDEWFAEAVGLLGQTGNALIWARLDWAARLRGDGRIDEARKQLHAAFAVARRTGYHGRTSRIVAELAAIGEPVLAAPDELSRLTGQELAVATTIAGGATVPAAAAELFLGPQTVEHDLLAACRKLGASSVDDLAARLSGTADRAESASAGWLITVLGQCRVQRGGVEVPVPAGRPGTLLQLVCAAGGPVPIDEAIEHLWAEVHPEVGRVRLRNVLARLRQAVGDVVRRDGDVLVLDPGVTVDADTFLAEADAALLAGPTVDDELVAAQGARALRWYAGPLLPEARYEPWAEEPRRRLHRRYLQLLDLLTEHARLQRRLDDAARYLELAIEADPYDHDRYLTAVEVRLLQDRRSAALHLIRRAREAAEELGVPVPGALEELELAASA